MKYRVFYTVTYTDRVDVEAEDELDARVEFDLAVAQHLATLKPTIFDIDITDILENPSDPTPEEFYA